MTWSCGSMGNGYTCQRSYRDHIHHYRLVAGMLQCLTTEQRNAEMSPIITPVVSALLVAIMEPQPWELRKLLTWYAPYVLCIMLQRQSGLSLPQLSGVDGRGLTQWWISPRL